MFTQPQRLRRFAVHVLLVWLFALGAGIANACVVQVQQGQDSTSAALSAVHDHQSIRVSLDESAVSHATLHQHHQHEDGADRTPPPCERLCNSPTVAPQPEKLQSNLLSGFWLAPAPAPAFAFESSIDTGRVVPSAPVRWRRAIPISIAFLRLAL